MGGGPSIFRCPCANQRDAIENEKSGIRNNINYLNWKWQMLNGYNIQYRADMLNVLNSYKKNMISLIADSARKEQLRDSTIAEMEQSYQNVLNIFLEKSKGLTESLSNLEKIKRTYQGYVDNIKQNNAKIDDIDSQTNLILANNASIDNSAHDAIKHQNSIIDKVKPVNNELYSIDKSKVYYQMQDFSYLTQVTNVLLLLYYIIVAIAIYFIYFMNIIFFKKIASIVILLIYPFIIYYIQHFVHAVWLFLGL
jgi:hypothetical protein